MQKKIHSTLHWSDYEISFILTMASLILKPKPKNSDAIVGHIK